MVASVMAIEYEMVLYAFGKQLPRLYYFWIYTCFQYGFQSWREYYIRQFVYIMLCTFLRVYNDWDMGKKGARYD